MKMPPETRERIAANLRRIMARRGMTQIALVEASGVDQRTVADVLQARRSGRMTTLAQLAASLGVSADELFVDLGRVRFVASAAEQLRRFVQDRPRLFTQWLDDDLQALAERLGSDPPPRPQPAVSVPAPARAPAAPTQRPAQAQPRYYVPTPSEIRERCLEFRQAAPRLPVGAAAIG